MATKAAGTLITTNNATYVPPSHMPGYQGHVPTIKYVYGETYGNKTQKYFQDFRSSTLSKSRNMWQNGGLYPTKYTSNPEMLVRSRGLERSRIYPRWDRTVNHQDRMHQLEDFEDKIQRHRDYYRDQTGCLNNEKHFVIPTTNEEYFSQLTQHVTFGWPDHTPRKFISEFCAPDLQKPTPINSPKVQLQQMNMFYRQGDNKLV